METLKLIFAISLFPVVIILIIYYFLKWFGKRMERVRFLNDYSYLEYCVRDGGVNEIVCKHIIERFNDIEQNSQKDPVKIKELRLDFEYKFRNELNKSEL